MRTTMWFMGVSGAEEWATKGPKFTLENVINGLTCDLVVFHGAADMQAPVENAHAVIRDAVNAKSKELHIYESKDGGEQHCHLDNLGTALGHMTDRVAELLSK